jgi:aerobic-type carbon monoxide dehydrogenase small subunit (CoxS/CutS family)
VQVRTAMTGDLCRRSIYPRILAAIQNASR